MSARGQRCQGRLGSRLAVESQIGDSFVDDKTTLNALGNAQLVVNAITIDRPLRFNITVLTAVTGRYRTQFRQHDRAEFDHVETRLIGGRTDAAATKYCFAASRC